MKHMRVGSLAAFVLALGVQPTLAAGDLFRINSANADTLIHDIQGNGATSPMVGSAVTVEAIVVGDFQTSSRLGGFFLQEETADADADAATSEGIFVADASFGVNVQVGDKVRVTGAVQESFELTRIGVVTAVEIVSSGNVLPTAPSVYLPFYTRAEIESFEGMRIYLPQELTVTENYNLGRYGQLFLSSGGRLMAPTSIALPGADAAVVQAANLLNRILVDDGISAQNPASIVYPAPELTASNTLRSGDTVTGVYGVLDYAFGDYRLHPTATPAFVASNPRTAAPAPVGGTLKVASFNVLNYFNGDGSGGGFPTARGASTLAELERQRAKIIAAITAMSADIIGLMELENDGYDATSALQELINSLNAAAPSGTSYDFIHPGVASLGTDAITVALIYRKETVLPVGSAAILTSSVDSRFDDTRNRPALAQTFEELLTGERLTVAVNHLKSKSSACVGDPDTGDGQGNCNLTRTSAALALVDWLAADPTGSGDSDVLIIGDLNAYALEDPITALKNGGYTDLIDAYIGADWAYSYVFNGQAGYLDHALASSSLVSQVTGVTEWHINTDEPRVLDYNVEFKTSQQVTSLYSPDPYRASDHDPVVVGLSLATISPDTAPTISIDGPASGTTVSGTAIIYVSAGDAEDAAGTLSVSVSIDGSGWQTAAYNSASGYYELAWDTTQVADGSHTIDAQVTDSAGNTSSAAVVLVDVSNGRVHVGDLDASSTRHGRFWYAVVTITVRDNMGALVPNATVSGSWSASAGTTVCTTASDGTCSVSLSVSKKTSAVMFSVSQVSHPSLPYEASANTDPDGDSNGTSITVYKP